MRTVAGERPLELAAVAKINRHARHRPNTLPVQDIVNAQKITDVFVGIQGRAEKPAVRAAKFIGQLPQHSQAENRPTGALGLSLGGGEIGIPIKSRNSASSLRPDLVYCR